MTMLESAFYPHHEPAAQQLHLALSQMYPTGRAAVFMAQKVNMDTGTIYGEQAPFLVWKEVLEQACVEGLLRELVEAAFKQFPNGPWHTFLGTLLANRKPATEQEPRSADGTAHFLHNNDNVTEPEALLFHDDLTLSAGQLPAMIASLQLIVPLVPAVCRLEVQCAEGVAAGTGFRISAERILTNWHVMWPKGLAAQSATATFGYEDGPDGTGLAGVALACQIASVQGSAAEDWAVVIVPGMPNEVPVLPLAHGAEAQVHAQAFVIQHPGGQRKRIAYTRNKITFCDDKVVQYLSDTQGGSSGSPVIDSQGRVIALHHAGGQPQEVAGQPPLKKNEGIAIARVLAGIRQLALAI